MGVTVAAANLRRYPQGEKNRHALRCWIVLLNSVVLAATKSPTQQTDRIEQV
jgi:hypothetical protein